jgi:hypothetical protein
MTAPYRSTAANKLDAFIANRAVRCSQGIDQYGRRGQLYSDATDLANG